jgi:hypothetical protein
LQATFDHQAKNQKAPMNHKMKNDNPNQVKHDEIRKENDYLADVSTHRQNAAEYAARTQYAEFPGTSLRIAEVRIAVDSTKCGQLPLCIQTDT